MTSTVRESLAKASKASDKLAALLCMAGSAEPAAALSGRLSRMADDARTLAGCLEKLSLQDADARDRERAAKERAWYRKKTQRGAAEVPAVESTVEIASEACEAAVSQAQEATAPTYFFNWATAPSVVEEEAEEIQGEL